ncbi:hypothetical protein H0Z60_09590 [Ectothiorhodospiraceae bacterium WFHF3C12]|nr:hypothetical protein [Ectothiorhodospiraceae bacterium WFHF3C12]
MSAHRQPPSVRRKRRRTIAGVALLGTLVATVASVLVLELSARPAGVLAWFAGALLWADVGRATRRQSIGLVALGVAGLAWGATQGSSPDWNRVLAANALIISLLAGVSFLRLVTRFDADNQRAAPRGRKAIGSTMLGLHLFGAVVNLSTLFIMAHAMAREGRLDSRQIRLLTRGYSAAAFWSPFFAGMAVALTYAPGARLSEVLTLGIPLALMGLSVTFLELARDRPDGFEGFPMDFSSLWLPAVLAALILGIHEIRPDLSVVAVLAGLSPALALVILGARRAGPLATAHQHVVLALPRMANELWLFLSAGVLAAGIASALAASGGLHPFETYGPWQASVTLLVLIAAAVAGIHPVISIAAASSVLLPLDPDPALLAVTFLGTWSIGTALSPLSGMNLSLQGAYDIPGRAFVRLNASYALIMWLAVSAAFFLYGALTNH